MPPAIAAVVVLAMFDSLAPLFVILLAPQFEISEALLSAVRGVLGFTTFAVVYPMNLGRLFSDVGVFGSSVEQSYYADKRPSRDFDYLSEKIDSSNHELRNTLKQFEALLKKADGDDLLKLSEIEREKLVSDIVDKSSITLTDESMVSLGKNHFSSEASIIQENALKRLSNQTVVLGERANRNLYVGILSALIGVGALGFLIFTNFNQQAASSYLELLQRYLPQLTAVLIIQFIAFYFLRLYAGTLNEIRFVQNEITNVELKFVALHLALASKEIETIKSILCDLSSTERNFILEKGQTTTEIEKERADSVGMAATVAAAAELIHGTKIKNKKRQSDGNRS